MPRCYKVSVTTEEQDGQGQTVEVFHQQFAGTQAEVRIQRDEFVLNLGVKKKDVDVEEVDIPSAKGELLEFINNLIKKEYKNAD